MRPSAAQAAGGAGVGVGAIMRGTEAAIQEQGHGQADDRDRDVASAVHEVVQVLEEEIVLGILHPRERLVEDDLMHRFSVKRHVVRNALAELDTQGLVQRKRNSGAQVRALTGKEVVELYALREILETSCARLIPFPVRPAALQQIVAVQRTHNAAVKKGDPRAVFRANLAFHAALHGLCGNDSLIEAITEYARRTYPVRLSTLVAQESLERARDEHMQIIEALRDGDRDLLVKLTARHLRPSRDAYLAILKRLGKTEELAS
ncbi:MAG: GntR family transcriptional regulator [Herminiimonas sp.]|nr:GntR family transcriptional regulator [Herminiimonas sp.]MDB5855519.1 GntR family transcriptional regulator [Herminiimonas sp.]